MKSAWRDRRNVHRAPLAAALLAAISFCPLAAGAADPTHPLTPSQRVDDANTYSSSGTPEHGEATGQANRPRLLKDGAVLYGVHCSSCHGANLAGMPGAPSLLEAGGAAVDFYMTTGRMPLALRAADEGADTSPLGAASASGVQAYHVPALFNAAQTAAVDTYVDARAQRRTPIPLVRLDPSKLQRGRLLFEENCQACHGAAAQGATAGGQWVALSLKLANLRQIGEAIRVGPGIMPRFTPNQLPDDDIDAVATYVRYLVTEPQTYGGAVMEYLGPISEGAVSAIIGVGFLFWVIYFTGTKADGRRLNELD